MAFRKTRLMHAWQWRWVYERERFCLDIQILPLRFVWLDLTRRWLMSIQEKGIRLRHICGKEGKAKTRPRDVHMQTKEKHSL